MRRLPSLIAAVEPLGCLPSDDDETRARKARFTAAMTLIMPAGLVWAVVYAAFGAPRAAAMPLAYAVLSLLNLWVLNRTRRFRPFQIVELALIIALPFALQLTLGGFVGGSAVVVWAFLGPLFAVLFVTPREATIWFGAFVAVVVVAGVAQPSLEASNPLPDWLTSTLFVMNLGTVSVIAFAMLISFVRARDQLRRLEVAYLEQNVMLRQQEKLATLGTLAAGVAHELNNPAAAVRRAADQMRPTLRELRRSFVALSRHELTGDQLATVAALFDEDGAGPEPAPALPPLEQSAREDEVEDWLGDVGVARPWDLAPTLVAMGYTADHLGRRLGGLAPAQAAEVSCLLAHSAALTGLGEGIAHGAARLSEIVGALRSYSYLDRGSVQTVDITEGLESTLVLLQAKLGDMRVERRYGDGVPRLQVHGNELNQVWTNIIDNAIGATGGKGTLVVRTGADDGRVVVELEDDGPGIPPGVVDRVFDPFFTTKPPGSGTGLGLNISHNIVVRQHGGSISVTSAPGRTCFRVELPLEQLGSDVPAAAGTGADGGASPAYPSTS